MPNETTVGLEKPTRDRLAAKKYDLGAADYDEAIRQLIDLHEQLENPDEILEN